MKSIGPIHGPATCPSSCSACSGRHHWARDGFDPNDLADEDADPHRLAVAGHDARHGTAHAMAFWACRHCPAWAEFDPAGGDMFLSGFKGDDGPDDSDEPVG